MVTLRTLCAIACALSIVFSSCTSKKDSDNNTSAEDGEWKPMDDFHTIMAESFHPFRDSADLGPAIANAESMAAAAEKWLNSPIPEKVDNDEVKAKLQELNDQAVSFVTISKGGDQNAIGKSLNNMHDLFHSLQEEWYEDHGEDHEQH